jgi:branched-chain amino acid aminotransferase
MNDALFSLNGQIVPEAQAVVPVTDRGFLYGDGLFESLHAYGPAVFRLGDHLDRLATGAEALFFENVPARRTLTAWINRAVVAAEFPEAKVRLTVTRGSGSGGPALKGLGRPNTVIVVTRYARPSAATLARGASAIIASFRRQETAVTARLKTLNYLEQILARREADLAGADEALLLNNAGMLCEGSASNLALVREGTLLVPDPERAGALPGIALKTTLAAARKLRLPVRLTCLSPWDPAAAQEACLTGSMREITPLVRLSGKPIGTGKPGPVIQALRAEYHRIVERECAPFRFR